MIGGDNLGTGIGCDFAVSATAATRVENTQPLELLQRETGLRHKGGTVFIVMGDLVLVPLQPETREMFLRDESRNPVGDRKHLFARRAFDIGPLGGGLEPTAAFRTAKLFNEFRFQSQGNANA